MPQYELYIRLGSFALIFSVMALWEIFASRRSLTQAKSKRWLNNLSLLVLNSLLLRLLFPAAAAGFAVFAANQGWGLLPYLNLPLWGAVLLAVLALDLIIYLQHVMFHALPTLWRLHRVHHADLDYDLTTGTRFHPLEIIISFFIKLAAIALLGPPVIAVVIFEILLNGTAMFNHANVRIPLPVDRLLRWLVVTPDMHRVHHSVNIDELNSNYGFNLPYWDRLFATYRDQPAAGHEGMTIGLQQWRGAKQTQSLRAMLVMPFLRKS